VVPVQTVPPAAGDGFRSRGLHIGERSDACAP
jgi:hypothetical protein